MRKIIIMFAAASVFAACNNSDLETKKEVVTTDSTSMFNSNASTDTATNVITDEPVVAAPTEPAPKVITKTKTVYVDRTPKRSTQPNATSQPQSQSNTGVGVPPPGTGTSTSSTGTSTVPANTGTTTAPAPAEKKEGMSNATKGAVIGGVGGAVGGAIISKKKGKGAIIGGIIGAAGGYILGKKKDNKADTTK